MTREKTISPASTASDPTPEAEARSGRSGDRGQPMQEATRETAEWRGFIASIASSANSALLLDFDGTLAPFRLDPAAVRPWAGVTALLNQIQQTGKTRIVLISGRPAKDVAAQLNLAQAPEVWGLHGAEHLLPNGQIAYEELPPRQQLQLKAAHQALEKSGWLLHPGIRLEEKWNAVVVHWRGLAESKAREASHAIHQLLQPIAADGALEMLLFDGGMELRAGRTKGDSVRLILSEMDPTTPAAYLGDDTTDESAFVALNAETTHSRGLSILVRRQWRPTAAQIWIRPPVTLRTFLNDWLQASSASHRSRTTDTDH